MAHFSGRNENNAETKIAAPVFYLVFGALALFAASFPYLYGWMTTPAGSVYTGLLYNIDDGAVYLSWIGQAMRGQFFQGNLFATEPQKNILFSVFFLLLGNVARLFHISPIAVYQLARVVFGGLLLWAVAAFLRETLAHERARRLAFALVCVSSGVGWLSTILPLDRGPIDQWVPESITFLSLYFTPLFTSALALMVVFVTSVLRAERTQSLRFLWPAMVSGAFLGNFHTYDVVTLFAVWGVFLVVQAVAQKKISGASLLRFALVLVAAFPTSAYQYYALKADPVFRARALDTTTLSPSVIWILLGYGLVFLLALAAAAKPAEGEFASADTRRFLLTWAIVGVVVAYVPVSFQRKLLMGEHLPLCALAGAALAAFSARLPGNFPALASGLVVLLTAPSNALFLVRDMGRLSANVGSTPHRPYLTQNEADALAFLRDKTPEGSPVLVAPDPTSHLRFPNFALYPHLSVYVPALAGRLVYNGHWSETPRFGEKMAQATKFFRADTTDEARRAFLAENNLRYVLYVNALGTSGPLADPQTGQIVFTPVGWPAQGVPAFLKPVYQNGEITVYEVTP